MFVVSSSNHIDMVTDDGQDTRQLLYSNATIKDIFYWNEQSIVSWATAQGLWSFPRLCQLVESQTIDTDIVLKGSK